MALCQYFCTKYEFSAIYELFRQNDKRICMGQIRHIIAQGLDGGKTDGRTKWRKQQKIIYQNDLHHNKWGKGLLSSPAIALNNPRRKVTICHWKTWKINAGLALVFEIISLHPVQENTTLKIHQCKNINLKAQFYALSTMYRGTVLMILWPWPFFIIFMMDGVFWCGWRLHRGIFSPIFT